MADSLEKQSYEDGWVRRATLYSKAFQTRRDWISTMRLKGLPSLLLTSRPHKIKDTQSSTPERRRLRASLQKRSAGTGGFSLSFLQ